MKEVKINWMEWVKKLSKKQLYAIAIVPALIVLGLLIWRIKAGNSVYDANWFIFALAVYYIAAFSPAGEQIQYRLFPQAIPHNDYQVTNWNQWLQALMTSFVLLIFTLLIWPPQNQGAIAIHLMGTVILGFVVMWSWRWYKAMKAKKQAK
ncbi:hypothetical protein G6R29_03335 [Fructobacillus sp. M2-14]|uniref:Uncharacterized protein n=1 Tax=Fructobacillus broussonetiae TaxID=2713173 RepID=A0ABS5QZR5_9LACO|nr:hypothetical protein [Fructobacillus broussonetiae]MBS9338664.1 hypothetical protein [Fructobacillus broussonetiae]